MSFISLDNKTGNWLSEADVDFLTSKGSNGGLSAEDQAIVNVPSLFDKLALKGGLFRGG